MSLWDLKLYRLHKLGGVVVLVSAQAASHVTLHVWTVDACFVSTKVDTVYESTVVTGNLGSHSRYLTPFLKMLHTLYY